MEYSGLVGQKVSQIYISSGLFGCAFFLQGGDIRIQRGYYAWRLCYEGKIVMSSADLYALVADQETADFWPMDCEEPDTIDYEEYTEFMFEQLYKHVKEKQDAVNNVLAGTTIVTCKANTQHDLLINFSNGAVFEVFALTNIKDGDNTECNIINIYDKESNTEQVFLV